MFFGKCDFFSKYSLENTQFSVDLFTFTKKASNRELHIFCSVSMLTLQLSACARVSKNIYSHHRRHY